jgi:hypothetical protein
MKGKSITFELALEPVAIETMLPEQTLAVHRGVVILRTFGQHAVDTVSFILLDLGV